MGFVYELPFAKNSRGRGRRRSSRTGRSTASSARSRGRRSRLPATTRRSTSRAGSRRSTRSPSIARVGDAGPDEVFYDPASFAQPGNDAGATRGATSCAARASGTSTWRCSRAIPFGRYRVEFRAQAHQRAEPHAMGQPGDRLHGPELHADPQQRSRPAGSSSGFASSSDARSGGKFRPEGLSFRPFFWRCWLTIDSMIPVATLCWRFSPPRPRPRNPPTSAPATRPRARP